MNVNRSNKRNGFTLKRTSRQYPDRNYDTDYADDPALLTNTPAQIGSLLHSLELVAGGFYVSGNKIEYFKQKGTISTLSDRPLKVVDQFIHLGNNISSTESDVNIYLAMAWNTIDIVFPSITID